MDRLLVFDVLNFTLIMLRSANSRSSRCCFGFGYSSGRFHLLVLFHGVGGVVAAHLVVTVGVKHAVLAA